MSKRTSKKQSHELDRDKLGKLLAWLHEDQVTAAVTLLELRKRLEFVVMSWHCQHPQECVDESLDRVAVQLSLGKEIHTENRFAYLRGVARNVARENDRKSRESFIPLDTEKAVENIPDPTDIIAEQELQEIEKQRLLCLDRCLAQLSESKRTIARFYFPGRGRDQARRRQNLGRLLHVSPNALRIRASRVRRELAECIHACMIESEAI